MALDGKPETGFPLTWPVAQPRTPAHKRVDAQWTYKLTPDRYRSALLAELGRLGAREVVISTNLPLRRDGIPMTERGQPDDAGVAVYFQRDGQPFVLACDKYTRVHHNWAGLAKVIESFRAIERHGSPSLLQHAMAGFRQLPAHQVEPSWWETLGIDPEATPSEIAAAHARLAQRHHPDRGGTHEAMARINRARDTALEERS